MIFWLKRISLKPTIGGGDLNRDERWRAIDDRGLVSSSVFLRGSFENWAFHDAMAALDNESLSRFAITKDFARDGGTLMRKRHFLAFVFRT